MGLSRTVSEIYGDFSRKSQNFPTPVYFAPPTVGIPLGIGYRRSWSKNRIMGYRTEKKFDDIFSHLDTIHQRGRQTDGQTDTGRQQRPRLRIASGGKNELKRYIC